MVAIVLIDLPNPEYNDTFRTSKDSLNVPINDNEINIAIKSLKLNKSSGVDAILNEYIISTKQILMPVYRKLFNLILENGIVPSDWVKGNIIPIYKNKGNKSEPANYRQILPYIFGNYSLSSNLFRTLFLFISSFIPMGTS